VQKRQEFSRPWLLYRTKALNRIAAEAAGDPPRERTQGAMNSAVVTGREMRP
jgi:hypothetical protein